MNSRRLRRNFGAGLLTGLRVVWPILSVLLALMIALGLLVRLLERWSVIDSICFAFVSGLAIGYGDLARKSLLTRMLAVLIGGPAAFSSGRYTSVCSAISSASSTSIPR